jgi:tryptophan synthase
MADGGTIQAANEVALTHGVSLTRVLALVKEARAKGLTLPVVLMGYYNPILAYGEARLATDCASVGVDGFIVVDLPPEHAATFVGHCDANGLGHIPLVAPTTDPARMPSIAASASGFIYCVSVTGVTGARDALPVDLTEFLGRVKAAAGDKPIAVGFGLSTRQHVDAAGKLADGVVMGSAIVRALEGGGVEGMKKFVASVAPTR